MINQVRSENNFFKIKHTKTEKKENEENEKPTKIFSAMKKYNLPHNHIEMQT